MSGIDAQDVANLRVVHQGRADADRGGGAGDVAVQINSATSINVSGQSGAISDLKPGVRVQVMASGGVASEIRVAGGGKARGDNPNKPKRDPNAPKGERKNKAK